MADAPSKVPVTEDKTPESSTRQASGPFDSLRRQVDRLVEDFDSDYWRSRFRRSVFDVGPIWRRQLKWGGAPAVDIIEADDAYELHADLPGVDGKNIDVKIGKGGLTIKAEKQEDKEEKKKNYFVRERHLGSVERRFALPEGVDTDRIEASFTQGVLTVKLPKKPEAIKPEKKIDVRTT
jgi:HSP20 family protein